MNKSSIFIFTLLFLFSCMGKDQGRKNNQSTEAMNTDSTRQYGYNVNFLKKYVRVIELKNGNSLVAVVPEWQGRVMTSSSEGPDGFSFGWINQNLFHQGKFCHILILTGVKRGCGLVLKEASTQSSSKKEMILFMISGKRRRFLIHLLLQLLTNPILQ